MTEGIIIGLVLGITFFTYRPFFTALKLAKFKPKALLIVLRDENMKAEFKNFSGKQLGRLQAIFAFAFKKQEAQNNPASDTKEEITESKQASKESKDKTDSKPAPKAEEKTESKEQAQEK